jgi:hypothetical protein
LKVVFSYAENVISDSVGEAYAADFAFYVNGTSIQRWFCMSILFFRFRHSGMMGYFLICPFCRKPYGYP